MTHQIYQTNSVNTNFDLLYQDMKEINEINKNIQDYILNQNKQIDSIIDNMDELCVSSEQVHNDLIESKNLNNSTIWMKISLFISAITGGVTSWLFIK
jgi:hypothetical protein